jgi:hypothetical protein
LLLLVAPVAIALPLVIPAAAASGSPPVTGAAHQKLEMDLSGNGANMTVGEPEIAINPLNPQQMWADGATFPVPLVFNGTSPVPDTCQGWSSEDGGLSWQPAPLPQDLQFAKGAPSVCGEDGVAVFGPDGTLYAGGDTATSTTIDPSCGPGSIHEPGGVCLVVEGFDPVLVSKDGGHSWGTPAYTMGSTNLGSFPFSPGAGNPINTFDRPWLAMDQSTNTLYAMSHNIADHEGFVTASTNEAKSFGTIYAIDSPDYPSGGLFGSTMAAAHGMLAVAYAATTAPGASCPCVIFETSNDHGATFTRHVVPTANASSQPFPFLAADPSAKGRYALTILDATGTHNQVYTTDDYGRTWKGPAPVAETPLNQQFKPWLAYGPSGQILLAWRTWHGSPGISPYDVWLAVGRDEGRHGAVFGAPVRVSSVAAAYPPPGLGPGQYGGGDDFSFVTASDKDIFVGWGDSRNVAVNVNGSTIKEGGGVQIWLARLSLRSFGG